MFQYDILLSNDTQVEELIGRNVRLDYVDLTLASNEPDRYPLVQKQFSKSSQESEDNYVPPGELVSIPNKIWSKVICLKNFASWLASYNGLYLLN